MSNEELKSSNPLAYYYNRVSEALAAGEPMDVEAMLRKYGQHLTPEQQEAVRAGGSDGISKMMQRENSVGTLGTCISGGPNSIEESEEEDQDEEETPDA